MNIEDMGIILAVIVALGGVLVAVVNRQIASFSLALSREIAIFGERIGNHERRIRALETQATENGIKLDNVIERLDEIYDVLKTKLDKSGG